MGGFLVHQTDERMFFLERQLRGLEYPDVMHIYAPNVLISANHLEDVEENNILIGGRADEEASALFNCINVKHYNMLLDETFQSTNCRLTAEGTLNLIIEHSMRSLNDIRVLVIGFGRTGAAVISLLSKLNVQVAIATNSSPRSAYAFSNDVMPLKNFNFSPYDVVINTVPIELVSDPELMTMKQGTVYIDLASKPAINLKYARHLGIDADIYPALPAKTCPESAGKAIYDYILKVTKVIK